jgi:hypothetical protein
MNELPYAPVDVADLEVVAEEVKDYVDKRIAIIDAKLADLAAAIGRFWAQILTNGFLL